MRSRWESGAGQACYSTCLLATRAIPELLVQQSEYLPKVFFKWFRRSIVRERAANLVIGFSGRSIDSFRSEKEKLLPAAQAARDSPPIPLPGASGLCNPMPEGATCQARGWGG